MDAGESIHDPNGRTAKCACASGRSAADLWRILRPSGLSRRNIHGNRERSRRIGDACHKSIRRPKSRSSEAHRYRRNRGEDCVYGNALCRFDTSRDRTRPAITRILACQPTSNRLDNFLDAQCSKLGVEKKLAVELDEPGIEKLQLIIRNVQKSDAHAHAVLHVNDLSSSDEVPAIA